MNTPDPTKAPTPTADTEKRALFALAIAIECPAVVEAETTREAIDQAPARLKRAIRAVEGLFYGAPTDSVAEAVLAQVLADLSDHARELYLGE